MTEQLPLSPAPAGSRTEIVLVDPATTRVSPINPRAGAPENKAQIDALAAEMKASGQLNTAHGERAADGVIEILAGSRRRAAAIAAGLALRVEVHADLPREQAIRIAYRDDREAITPSLWDLSAGWATLLADKVVKTDSALAGLVGVDKSTMSRGLAFQKTPEPILAAFGDRRAVSLTQWIDLAPLVEGDETRAPDRARRADRGQGL